MRKSFVFGLAIATAWLLADGAWADTVKLGPQSASGIQKACKSAGGKFWVSGGGKEFGCDKENCDGKGGQCSVTCHKGGQDCLGSTPGAPPPGKYDLVKILKFSPRRPPGPGVLEPTPGASPHGPSGTGTPKPPAPPAGRLY